MKKERFNKLKTWTAAFVAVGLLAAFCLMPIQVLAAQESEGIVYEAEAYYAGNISEGVAADMQPNETIEISLKTNEKFTSGKYTLTVRSCGNRESFEILVNGESVGTISRTGTGFGQNQMTSDQLDTALDLGTDDVITIKAPADAYGWVDHIRLDLADEGGEETIPDDAVVVGEGYFVYQTEHFYSGNVSEGVAADMQPNESIEICLNAKENFVAGKYTLTVRSCGNRESFEILVNGESVGTISRTGTGFGQDQMTDDALNAVLELGVEDVVTIKAPADAYGWVDYLKLTAYQEKEPEKPEEEEKKDPVSGEAEKRVTVTIEAESGTFDPAAKKESGTSDQGNTWISGFQNMTASYKLGDNFAAGNYRISMLYVTPVSDCSIEITVNGVTKTVKIAPSDDSDAWNWEKAELGKLLDVELKAGDEIQIKAVGTTPWIQIDYFKLIPLDENGNPIPETADETALLLMSAVLMTSVGSVAILLSKRRRFL